MPAADHCAIDFGTSNSAVALSAAAAPAQQMPLVALEGQEGTMPTAVFYLNDPASPFDENFRHYGRAAVAAYVDGLDGRLMRSMKSILGSSLLDQATEVGPGVAVRYADVLTGYLRRLKRLAEEQGGAPLRRVVLGRPVYFVDGDPARDARAQQALQAAARQVGFEEVHFQFEPIAAALDHEATLQAEQLVLVADIGGGTSDFSLVRVGPQRRTRLDRREDILANHGVHIAGTDFDRRLNLRAIMPMLGLGSLTRPPPGGTPREVPSGLYFDLATWHLINTCYTPARLAEARSQRHSYADARAHERLMTVLTERLGHGLAAAAEGAKITTATQGQALLALHEVEHGLEVVLTEAQAAQSLEADIERIEQAARETLQRAGVAPQQVDCLYCTGGSTGLASLVNRLAAGLPRAQVQRGDRFASVARGLGLHARALFGAGA